MELVSYYANAVSFGVVVLTWFIFAATFLLRKKPESAPESKREQRSFIGIALQGVGFALVWSLRRNPALSPLFDAQYILNIVLQILAIFIVVASVWLARTAIGELGKQWSFEARLIEGHKLVTSGVYQIVRHPIYTAMFGMLVATGLVFSHWIALAIAVVVFLIGTRIRTSLEEKLLREQFPEEYQNYSRSVPGLIPFLKWF